MNYFERLVYKGLDHVSACPSTDISQAEVVLLQGSELQIGRLVAGSEVGLVNLSLLVGLPVPHIRIFLFDLRLLDHFLQEPDMHSFLHFR